MINKIKTDVAIIGAGIMGCSTAVNLANSGLSTVIIDKNKICRGASGVNAGTLTIHMTRAKLIPYAIKGWELWTKTKEWLGEEIEVTKSPGLCLAFSENDEELLVNRSKARIENGAPIKIISKKEALKYEPTINPNIRMAAYCEIDGYVNSYKTGLVFAKKFKQLGVKLKENMNIKNIINNGNKYEIRFSNNESILEAKKILISGGVWLNEMLKWFDLKINLKCLPQQLIITERLDKILKSVITIANGKLSMKQYPNGTVLIGGGWPGNRSKQDTFEVIPNNLIGNMQLACHSIPKLKKSRVVRVWGGLEAETKDAMPIMDKLPNFNNVYALGSFHSGYTSGPYVGYLMSEMIKGNYKLNHNLFSLSRLL